MSSAVAVVMISRGLGPLRTVVAAMRAVQTCPTASFDLVEGRPAAEAKNCAVQIALTGSRDLLLIEDDILADDHIWACALSDRWRPDTVGVAETRMRNGQRNARFKGDGSLLYAGTCFIRLPLEVLRALPNAPFRAEQHQQQGDELVPIGPDPNGCGSDLSLFRQLHALTPAPTLRLLGSVTQLWHALNSRWDLNTPCQISDRPPARL